MKYKVEVFNKLKKKIRVYYSRTENGARKRLLELIRANSVKVIKSRRDLVVLEKDDKTYVFEFD